MNAMSGSSNFKTKKEFQHPKVLDFEGLIQKRCDMSNSCKIIACQYNIININ